MQVNVLHTIDTCFCVSVGRDRSSVGMAEERYRMRKLKALLGRKLAEFLSSDVRYGIRRVLAAELKDLYIGPQTGIVCMTF